jgi:threonine/homoserine/homoserine lactone efflux protein
MTIDYLLTCIIVILLPGTGVIYTLAVGLGQGLRASVAASIGCTLGILPAALASIVGLAAILHTSALAFQMIKFLGIAYLLYMAWNVLRSDSILTVKEDRSQAPFLQLIINGFLLNVLNPKLSLFFMAFLPQFVPTATANTTAMLVLLAGVFMALTLVIFIAYGAFASLARNYVISRPSVMTWCKRVFAGSFGLLSLKLALSDR